jgi:acylphosphatase
MPKAQAQHAQGYVRVHATVYGRVQGVGFRYATQRTALEMGLHGFVRNRWNGTVQVVAEGKQATIDRLVSWLQHGPRMAYVTRVETTYQIPTHEFDTFEVRF